MNCKHRFDFLIFFWIAVEAVQKYRNQSRLPVVCVNNVGNEIHNRHRFENSFREESKSFAVVEMSVKSVPFEIIFVVYEVISYSFIDCLKHAAILTTPTKVDKRRTFIRHKVLKLGRNFRFVIRNDDSYVVTQCFKRFRKSGGNVAKSARSDERTCFWGCK